MHINSDKIRHAKRRLNHKELMLVLNINNETHGYLTMNYDTKQAKGS